MEGLGWGAAAGGLGRPWGSGHSSSRVLEETVHVLAGSGAGLTAGDRDLGGESGSGGVAGSEGECCWHQSFPGGPNPWGSVSVAPNEVGPASQGWQQGLSSV